MMKKWILEILSQKFQVKNKISVDKFLLAYSWFLH